uniref:ATPase AAA-type core domain-containing protein n=1 Tax=Physcomitrium patens TaxID=3218 RepID=A0A2K1IQW2_PHYPA|nr:hypothetical protein PHYPA_025783 [Physcomitrium patens]
MQLLRVDQKGIDIFFPRRFCAKRIVRLDKAGQGLRRDSESGKSFAFWRVSSGGNFEHESTRKSGNEVAAAWDGLWSKDRERVLVFSAINRPFDLDDAVTRRLPTSKSWGQ